MKFIVILKGNAEYEAGAMPGEALIAAMTRFNEEMAQAGILRAAEGLFPSARGARIRIDGDGDGDERSMARGPFDDAGALMAGFWVIDVATLDEAIDWMQRCPHPFEKGAAEIEIRQLFSGDDFGEAFTPDLRAREQQLRSQVDAP
ncbi:YciI family protein [Massilia sp. 9096]|uniref:YciI family protein n=1 Tax=Massilia sp. 9096 TaxID=1500894 RepID=UPI00056A41B5|nr:YciI family protein [Massilia sp. 9096]